MEYRVKTESIRNAVNELLTTWDIPDDQAGIITDTIVYAHRHEKHTHGITRLPIYKEKIDAGLMTADTQPEIVTQTPAVTVFDCKNGFGQIAAHRAMEECIRTASDVGIGVSFVRNSNNFGVTGYFAEMAADKDMVGMVITSSGPAIAPPKGTKPIFGTNPYACAFPCSEGNVVLDMAMSEAARGKIRLAEKNGEKIPYGWAVDKDGNPTDDPTAALSGNMLAIGGVKGFGLAMVIDYMAGLLSGSAFGGDIKPLAARDGYSAHGHMLMAVNINMLMPTEEYEEKIRIFTANIKACGNPGDIKLPGESSRMKAEKNKETLKLNSRQVNDFNDLASVYGIRGRIETVS